MDVIIYWGGMLSFAGFTLLTFLNTIYAYRIYQASLAFPATLGVLVRTTQFWLLVLCIAGFLIFGLLRNPNSGNVYVELFRLFFSVLLVMTIIILVTVWGIWKMSSSDKNFQ